MIIQEERLDSNKIIKNKKTKLLTINNYKFTKKHVKRFKEIYKLINNKNKKT